MADQVIGEPVERALELIVGPQGSPTTSIYNVSKHAVIRIMTCLALEVGSLGTRVNVLCPGLSEHGAYSHGEPFTNGGGLMD